jgi:hypothetical protein
MCLAPESGADWIANDVRAFARHSWNGWVGVGPADESHDSAGANQSHPAGFVLLRLILYSVQPHHHGILDQTIAMLYLVGLGLSDETDITVKGLEIVKKASRVYLEAYTSILLVDQSVLVRHMFSFLPLSASLNPGAANSNAQ